VTGLIELNIYLKWRMAVAFNIAQLAAIFTSHGTPIPFYLMWCVPWELSHFSILLIFRRINIYISTIGLVFATVWSNSTNPNRQHIHTSNAVSTAFRSTAGPFSNQNNRLETLAFTHTSGTVGDSPDIGSTGYYIDGLDGSFSSEKKKKPQAGGTIPLTVQIDESRTTSSV
jgi:hypothetical protein